MKNKSFIYWISLSIMATSTLLVIDSEAATIRAKAVTISIKPATTPGIVTGTSKLPEGDTGIGSRYPNDKSIGLDPDVIFADDFESYTSASQITQRWDEAYQATNLRIATEAGNFYGGQKALEFTAPKITGEVTNTAIKNISPTQDILFVRFFAKIDSNYSVTGSSHNGAIISASYWDGPGSGPGIKADGYNKFLVSYEHGRQDTSVAAPGDLTAYVYHPLQRDVWGDIFYPHGEVSPITSIPFSGGFGADFVSRPNRIPKLGQWYCYELMVRANAPGTRDGRIAMWLDGNLIADFMNIRFRDTLDLKIDHADISFHVNGGNTATTTRKWYDNVVMAKSYVGCPKKPIDNTINPRVY